MADDKVQFVIELKSEGYQTLDKAEKKMKGVGITADKAAPKVQKFWKEMLKGDIVMRVLYGGLRHFTGIFADSIQAAMEQQEAWTQLEAVYKSTGGAIGMSIEELKKLSGSLQNITTYSDSAILGAENLLLTFTNISKKVFPEATKIVLDMSTALGQDLKTSAIQVGKALQDPVLGVTALRRVGVNFSKDQAEMIKKLVETGKALEAQKYILEELKREFGGSAAAMVNTYEGALKQIGNIIGDIKEEFGFAIMNALLPSLRQFREWLIKNQEAVQEWVRSFGRTLGNIFTFVKDLIVFLIKMHDELVAIAGTLAVAFSVNKVIAFAEGVRAAGGALNMLKAQLVSIYGVVGLLIVAGLKFNRIINEWKGALGQEVEAMQRAAQAERERMEYLRRIKDEYIKAGGAQEVWRKKWHEYLVKYKDALTATNKMIRDIKAGKLGEDLAEAFKKAGKFARDTKGEIDKIKGGLDKTALSAKELQKALGKIGVMPLEQLSKETEYILALYNRFKGRLAINERLTKQFAAWVHKLNEQYLVYGKKAPEALKNIEIETNFLISLQAKSAEALKKTMDAGIMAGISMRENFEAVNKAVTEGIIALDAWGKEGQAGAQNLEAALSKGGIFGAFEKIKRSLSKIFGSDLVKFISSGISQVGNVITTGLGTALGGIFSMIGSKVLQTVMNLKGVQKVFSELGRIFNMVLEPVLNLFGDIIEAVADMLYPYLKLIEAVLKPILSALGTVFDIVGKALKGIAGLFGSLLGLSKDSKEEVKSLGEQFEDARKEAEKFGDVATRSMIEIIKKARETNQVTDEMKQYIHEALQKGIEGFNAWAKAIGNTKGSFERAERMALRYFNTLLAEGWSFMEALNQMGDGLDSLFEKAQKFGFSMSDAFKHLARMRELAKANEELFNAIDGLNEMLKALGNSAYLTGEDFRDFQQSALEMYKKLLKAGASEKEALQALAPYLENLLWYSQQYGYQLDKNTQKLIEQAKKQGLLKGAAIPWQEKTVALLEEIVKLLGGEIPYAIDKLTGQVNDRIGKIIEKTHSWKKALEEVAGVSLSGPPGGGGGHKYAQHGFVGWTTRPTTFTVAEREPEFVMAIPASKMGRTPLPYVTREGEVSGSCNIKVEVEPVVIPIGSLLEEWLIKFIPRATREERLMIHKNAIKGV